MPAVSAAILWVKLLEMFDGVTYTRFVGRLIKWTFSSTNRIMFE